MFLERQVQHIRPGKWEELEVLDQKYNKVENRNGFPGKRRLRCYIGGLSNNTLVIEREWESLAAMEAAYMKLFMDPDWQALSAPFDAIGETDQMEVYLVLS